MFTDAPPRKQRAGFFESDRIKTLDLPRDGVMTEITQRLESATKSDKIRNVPSACTEFLATASNFYEVPICAARVLAARPLRSREHGTFELFGDYAHDSNLIRVRMSRQSGDEVCICADAPSQETAGGIQKCTCSLFPRNLFSRPFLAFTTGPSTTVKE